MQPKQAQKASLLAPKCTMQRLRVKRVLATRVSQTKCKAQSTSASWVQVLSFRRSASEPWSSGSHLRPWSLWNATHATACVGVVQGIWMPASQTASSDPECNMQWHFHIRSSSTTNSNVFERYPPLSTQLFSSVQCLTLSTWAVASISNAAARDKKGKDLHNIGAYIANYQHYFGGSLL